MVRSHATPEDRAGARRAERAEHDRIAQRLRDEAALARVVPPPRLHHRTLAALESDRRRRRLSARSQPATTGAYALAAALVLLVGAAAVVHLAAPRPDPAPRAVVADGLERLSPRRIATLTGSWERPLAREARLLARDARAAAESVLAQLPGGTRSRALSIEEEGEEDAPRRAAEGRGG